MSLLEIVARGVAGLALVALNAFFVGTEFALTRLRQFDQAELQQDPALRRAWRMTERLELYLTSCQVGITTSSILLGVVAEPAVSELVRPLLIAIWGTVDSRTVSVVAVALAVVVINLVHMVWGEQVPTYLGVEDPLRVARWAARPHELWTRAMYPLIHVGDGIAKWTLGLFGIEMSRSWREPEEAAEGVEAAEPAEGEPEIAGRAKLRRQMGEVLTRGGVSPDRQEEVIAAMEIGSTPVTDIMVSRDEIVALSTRRSFDDNLRVIAEGSYVRYPLIGDRLEDFVGIVYVPGLVGRLDDLREGRAELADVAAEPFTVGADCEVARLIDLFQEVRQELALVEEDGRIVGLVTATDAFEAIAGDLRDPLD